MKHVYFSYYFIEKIHLKKYTDILLLWIADKDALKVNSIYIDFLSSTCCPHCHIMTSI